MSEPRRQPAGRGAQNWREASAAAVPRKTRRRRRLFAVLAAMGALAAVLVALLLLVHRFRAPYLLSVPVVAYDAPFPVNALARADSDALCDFFPDHRQAADSQERRLLEKELDALRQRGRDETVLVHLSALARTDGGKVTLLPADASPDRPDTGMPLDAVLTALAGCPARHKVLILDVARPVADPRLGVLADDVAARLPAALGPALAEDAALWVLLPCSPGQLALTSEELGQSVFGHFLAEGLRGRADGCIVGTRADGVVALDELGAYLTARVDRWAQRHRGTRQTPLLLPRDRAGAGAVELTQARVAGAVPARSAEAAAYPEPLKAGWKHRDQWAGERVAAVAPRPFRELEMDLVRAEQRWRGQDLEAGEVEHTLRGLVAPLDDERAAVGRASPRAPQPRSLALAAALGEKPPEGKAVNDLRDLARDEVQADHAKDRAAAREALKPKEEALRKQYQGHPAALAWAVFEAAADDVELDADRLAFYARVLAEIDPQDPRFAETLLLRRLAEAPKGAGGGTRPADVIRLALQVARDGERAAACQAGPATPGAAPTLEPVALPWVYRDLPSAERHRREGERLLLDPDPARWEQAREVLRQAAQEYDTLRQLVRAIADARRQVEEAWSFLPDYAPYRLATRRPEAHDDADWSAAVRATAELAGFLARPPEPGAGTPADAATSDEFQKRTKDLRRPLDGLRGRLRERLTTFRPGGNGGPPDPDLGAEADALLKTPLLAAAERVTVWESARQQDRQTPEEQDEGAPHGTEPLPAPDAAAAERAEADRAARRAHCLVDLLHVAGLAGWEDLERETRALGSQAPATAWQALGPKLRAACTEGLADQLRQRLAAAGRTADPDRVPADLVTADRLSRAVNPLDAPALFQDREAGRAAATRLRRARARALWRAMGNRYREEADRLAKQPSARDFFARAAEEYLDASVDPGPVGR